MCNKYFRRFSLIFVLLLHLPLVSCGGGFNTINFSVVVFSDVHFDPFYDPSLFKALVAADADEWANIFKTSNISAPLVWGSDTNYPLLMLALSSIKQNLGVSPLIIFSGDILTHKFHQTFYTLYGSQDVQAMEAFADKTVAFFLEQVRASAGNLPVMFAVGNNDSYEDLGPDSAFLSNTAELYYTELLNGTVDHQAFLSTFKKGGYYSAEPPGTNLMVIGINTALCAYLDNTTTRFDEELRWLDKTLTAAKDADKKVWLIMHVPPGANTYSTAQSLDNNGHIADAVMMWSQDYQASFLQILSKYPGIITMSLAGHTHMDEYRIMLPDNVLEVTPAISPRSGNDPAFKIFTLCSDTLKPIDYRSLNYDLATMPGQFNIYYTFSSAYCLFGFLNDSLEQLFPALVTNNRQQGLYREYYYSGNNSLNSITDTNWPVYWSGIANMEQQEFIDSVNFY